METSGRRDVPDVALFPPFPFLPLALELLRGTSVKVGAQNIGLQTKGAFTGEVSASQVASLGCECVLLGHSERRALFDEDDETINAKVHLALGSGLKVVLCVGETQTNTRWSSSARWRGAAQEGLKDVSAADAERIVVARAGVGDRHRAGGDARAGAGGARGDPPRPRRDLRRRNGAADRHPVRRLRDAREHRRAHPDARH